jgi:hypothetical protein
VKALSHIHGSGDFFQADKFWTPEFRAELETIAWLPATKPGLMDCLAVNPEYQHLKHIDMVMGLKRDKNAPIMPTTYFQAGVQHLLPFVGSSFLRHKLADVSRFNLPDDYILVQTATPKAGQTKRDATPQEVQAIAYELGRCDIVGVVVNSERFPLPESPRLIDLQGRTTMPEAIELLKGAKGYFGVDSCFAILASELFTPECLWIKTVNPWLAENRHTYYAPQTDFSFLVPSFGAEPYPAIPPREPYPDGYIVQLKSPLMIGARSYAVGDVVEVWKERAQEIIFAGCGELYDLEGVNT